MGHGAPVSWLVTFPKNLHKHAEQVDREIANLFMRGVEVVKQTEGCSAFRWSMGKKRETRTEKVERAHDAPPVRPVGVTVRSARAQW